MSCVTVGGESHEVASFLSSLQQISEVGFSQNINKEYK